MRKTDRELVLEKIDPKNKDIGLVDVKVLSGDNRLLATMDEHCYWTMKYDHGLVPAPFKERFTSFKLLKEHADLYFSKKNIKIVEVKD